MIEINAGTQSKYYDPQPLTGEPIHLFDTLEPAIITDVMPHVPQEIVKNKVNQ
jgi:hypothetical protein